MPPPPVTSETIVIPFLCGSLVLSFLLAALAAVFKVYRPLVPVGERLRGMFRKEVREKQTRVELVDNGFEGRESVMREQGLAYPALAVVAEIR